MADRFYSADIGDQLPEDITEGGASLGGAIELRVDSSAYSNLIQVISAVEGIKDYLETVEIDPIRAANLLLESGYALLQETGDRILLS